MKKVFLLTVVLMSACIAAYGQRTFLENWKLNGPGVKDLEVKVPCTVAGAISVAGLDVSGADYDRPWTFSTSFDAEKGACYQLDFQGLGYYADIKVNGKCIAAADTTYGVFINRLYDITPLVKKHNRLEVTLNRARKGDLNIGFVDWNPRPADESMGIVRPVALIRSQAVTIDDVFVIPHLDTETLKSADIEIRVRLRNLSGKKENAMVKAMCEGWVLESNEEIEAFGTKEVVLTRNISKPRVWWCRELGSPELYSMDVAACLGSTESDRVSTVFGIRKIEGIIDSAGHRQFILNGVPVLIKGAGWTDDVLLRDTHASNEQQVRYVADMGLNCIRFENIWGKDSDIYDLCDRYGILAMVGFSCQWEWENYCGLPEVRGFGCINTEESENLAVRYFHDQVRWLHNHPSLIAWLTGSDRVPNARLEKRYMDVFAKEDYRPYVCSASNATSTYGGPSGMKMEGPYEYVAPDYWYLDTKKGGAFGFNTETCTGASIPQKSSLERMIDKENLWPVGGQAWNRYCTASSSAMNTTSTLEGNVKSTYGEVADLDDFVKKAHALDYDGTRAMFEAFRCNRPNTTGIVQWMLNSACPSIYWQLYDWYGVPTAAYYGVKKACAPCQMFYNYGSRKTVAVSDYKDRKNVRAVIKVFDKDCTLISEQERTITLKAGTPQEVFDLAAFASTPVFASCALFDRDGGKISDNFYCIAAGNNVYDWKKSNWYVTPIKERASLEFVSSLAKAEVVWSSKATEEGMEIILENTSDVISYQNILNIISQDGKILSPVFWDDNFLTLLPKEKKRVRCRFEGGLKDGMSISLEGWNSNFTKDYDLGRARDLSRYANDSFSKDDRYRTENTYPTVSVRQPKGKKVKNIIVMIGDGMGFEQMSCAWILNGGHLNMDNCLYTGVSRTYTTDKLLTDSCAGGSAIGTGVKTRYGFMGLDPEGKPVENAVEAAKAAGMKTGICVTCRLNDATPIDFCGHSGDRHDEEGIAAQYASNGVDFVIGGGNKLLRDRSDGRDIVAEMVEQGYTNVTTSEELAAARKTPLVGVFGDYEMDAALDRGDIQQVAVRKALELLDNKNGFFMMIEGSRIDDYCHHHQTGHMAEETLDFDRCVGEVLKWAEKDGQTLVVITADHATGGLTLLGGDLSDRSIKVNYSTKGHNGIFVPVLAYGPQAELFCGMQENEDLGKKIISLIKK